MRFTNAVNEENIGSIEDGLPLSESVVALPFRSESIGNSLRIHQMTAYVHEHLCVSRWDETYHDTMDDTRQHRQLLPLPTPSSAASLAIILQAVTTSVTVKLRSS
jgi:hypothetical protein